VSRSTAHGIRVVYPTDYAGRAEVDDMQFGFMKGKGTTDAIFTVRQMQENFREF